MDAITASLAISLRNVSLNDNNNNHPGSERSSTKTTLELNSHLSLPHNWEQCLDLKTGEIYYINWRSGMKAKEDPRLTGEYSGDLVEEEEDNCSYDDDDSEEVFSTYDLDRETETETESDEDEDEDEEENVLVVGGCKTCLMYFMVPEPLHHCPKCRTLLIHFHNNF